MAAWARSSDIGGPYAVSKGILSGTKSRGFVSVGCSARLAPGAFPVFSFDIRPPSMVAVEIARSTMGRLAAVLAAHSSAPRPHARCQVGTLSRAAHTRFLRSRYEPSAVRARFRRDFTVVVLILNVSALS